LGQYAQARQVCQAALATRNEADLVFVVMFLHVQLELAIAEAGLGEAPLAHARLAALSVRHAAASPLMLGAVHEARVRVALIERDFAACREHLARMRSCYIPTQIPSLAELTRELATSIDRAQAKPLTQESMAQHDASVQTVMQRPFTHSQATLEKRALRCLHTVLELTRAKQGFIAASSAAADVICADAPPRPEVLEWAAAYLERQDDQTVVTDDEAALETANELVLGDMTYRVAVLYARDANRRAYALVLGFQDTSPCMPHPHALVELATRMFETTRNRST
jgi:hypothetical protein